MVNFLLKGEHEAENPEQSQRSRRNWFVRIHEGFNRGFERARNLYVARLEWALKHARLARVEGPDGDGVELADLKVAVLGLEDFLEPYFWRDVAGVLGFDHPATGQRLRFEEPLPADLLIVLDHLGPPDTG